MNTTKEKAASNKSKTALQKRHLDHTGNSAFSQRQRILEWFKRHPSMTTEQARRQIDCMHPAARIMELRKRGYDIMTYWENYPTAAGKIHRMAKYVMMSRAGGQHA